MTSVGQTAAPAFQDPSHLHCAACTVYFRTWCFLRAREGCVQGACCLDGCSSSVAGRGVPVLGFAQKAAKGCQTPVLPGPRAHFSTSFHFFLGRTDPRHPSPTPRSLLSCCHASISSRSLCHASITSLSRSRLQTCAPHRMAAETRSARRLTRRSAAASMDDRVRTPFFCLARSTDLVTLGAVAPPFRSCGGLWISSPGGKAARHVPHHLTTENARLTLPCRRTQTTLWTRPSPPYAEHCQTSAAGGRR